MIKNLILFIVTTSLLVTGQAFWKIASSQITGTVGTFNLLLNLVTNVFFLTGCAFYFVATGLWIYLLGQYDYSKIYPIFVSTCIILSLIMGSLLFQENTGTSYKIFGVILILCGVIVIAKS